MFDNAIGNAHNTNAGLIPMRRLELKDGRAKPTRYRPVFHGDDAIIFLNIS